MRVVITGASSGLGSALASEFARRFPGAVLLLVARRAERLAALAAQLPQVRCECAAIDVTEPGALNVACEAFLQRHGVPDVVIANAGISAGTVTGATPDRAVFRRIVEVNLLAMYDTFEPFVEPMRAGGGGILVGIGSVAGIRGLPGAEAYSASKAAVHAYLESMRVGLRGSGVAVVTLTPGYIRSEMTATNAYPMPFLMPADRFARLAVDAILRRESRRTIPWQMGWAAWLLALLPNWLYDRLLRDAPRKAKNPGLGSDVAAESAALGSLVATVVAAAVLAGCSSTPAPRAAPGFPGTLPGPAAGGADAGPGIGASAPRGGGYYLDDGPGSLQPAELQALLSMPEPVPVAEPLHPWANRPYRVMGNDYRPMTRLEPFVERGVASWYGRRFHGRSTSIGERYDMYGLTAAHPTLPLPSYVRVTNLENARSVIVRVNDRGPFLHGRAIDLSFLAASKLGYVRSGSAEVEVELLHPPAPTGPAAPQPHYLQLGAFAAPAGAEAASARLRQQLQWLQVPIEVQPHGSLYRVRAGPFAEREHATRAGAEVASRTGLRPVLVPALADQPISGPGW